MNLRCLILPHDTRLIAAGDYGCIRCVRCGYEVERWRLLRPEFQNIERRQHDRLMADRERRASWS